MASGGVTYGITSLLAFDDGWREESFKSLTFQFYRGASTIGLIVRETTQAIWDSLQPVFMPIPTEEMWKGKAQRYQQLWNLPNCIAAIEGNHIRVKNFAYSGSSNFNYKGYSSIVLMASADADSLQQLITSHVGNLLRKQKLNLPEPQHLPGNDDGDPFPFYKCGDEAFPLLPYLMRPYPKRVVNSARRSYNFRLSRGRKSIECAFGILTSKFRIFEGPICCEDETVKKIVQAACVLHNFIRVREGIFLF
ncbi:hypothetical protein NQ317_001784 [Molorchus minor]|uniref:DDE Tnp4 domain-containing protein n=1 Tax=Molorchus minor TaxID=1323400 RepID=A0ABQ9JDI1_9CUCU|nr:hypothetical protein NQ317_001784 [Molorchus minor]